MGAILNKDGTRAGAVTVAQLADRPQLLVYWVRDRDRTGYAFNGFLADLQEVVDGKFRAVNPRSRRARAGTYRVEGVFDSAGNRLAGTVTEVGMSGGMVEVLGFEADFIGTGREKVIEALKRNWFSTGKYQGSWTNVGVQSLGLGYFDIELP